MSVLRSALQPMLTDVQLKWDVKVDGKTPEILVIPSKLPPLFSANFMTAFGLITAGMLNSSERFNFAQSLLLTLNNNAQSTNSVHAILILD